MRGLKEYRKILQKKGLYVCLQEAWNRVWKIRYCRDLSVIRMNEEYRVYAYLRRKYRKVLLDSADSTITHTSAQVNGQVENPYPNRIWTLWLQGVEAAPEIVQHCIRSQERYCGNMEVVILTNENLLQYVHLPEYIWEKHKKGIISFTHLSDIIRVNLLAQYGGVWLDATCLLTDTLPDYIAQSKGCFVYRSLFSETKVTRISSWCMAAPKADGIILDVQRLLWAYWQRENRLRHYYLIHLFFTLAITEKHANKERWTKLPYLNNANPHMLQERLFAPYDAEWMEQILKPLTSVHKLTYKFADESFTSILNTFYQHILRG